MAPNSGFPAPWRPLMKVTVAKTSRFVRSHAPRNLAERPTGNHLTCLDELSTRPIT